LTHSGVGELFTDELISAATQVNYGSPVTQIHGVGALVSLAATGATSVHGGNRRIFEEFVGRSGARLRLGETARVQSILKLDAAKGKRAQWVVKTASGVGGGTYDVRPPLSCITRASLTPRTYARRLSSSPRRSTRRASSSSTRSRRRRSPSRLTSSSLSPLSSPSASIACYVGLCAHRRASSSGR